MILNAIVAYFILGLVWAIIAFILLSRQKTNKAQDLAIWFLVDTLFWPLALLLYLSNRN